MVRFSSEGFIALAIILFGLVLYSQAAANVPPAQNIIPIFIIAIGGIFLFRWLRENFL